MSDKVNILVVDDLPENLLVLESILAELQEHVITARSGAEALRQILQKEFAVILLDVNMPGMDGFETAALIRQRKKSAHVPIIFLTAFADELHTAQGYSLGAVDYILSPVVPDILRTKVQVFVDLFRMTQQVKRQAEERIALMQEQAARVAAEAANRRLAFLAQAGNVLGRSLDYEATARDVAQLAISYVADLSAVTLVEPSDGDWKTILVRTDARGDTSLVEFRGREGLPDALAEIIDRVLCSGVKEFLPRTAAVDSDMISTAVVFPLQARGQVIGTLALALGSSGDYYNTAEVTVAEAFASRAAVALENALLYSDVQRADRQKNEFLSMLAHELRNPLAPIHNAVKILSIAGLSESELQWAREVIDRQVMQLVRLVDDLLDVSRITQGKVRLHMEPVEVQTIVAQALETSRPLLDARQHRLSVSLPSEPLWVYGDTIRLVQVLTNLLNNAAKYTDEGGHIWLGVASESGDVVLRVRDSGIGIPPSMLSSIFELFAQVDRSLDRSHGGLGVGLTLVRHLVQMHGGNVRAFSFGTNQGSEFVVRLPLHVSADRLPTASNGEAKSVLREPPYRVLVVDDNQDAADSLAMLLHLQGYEIRTAHDGPTALEVVTAFRPMIVLLDIGLPEMDGYEVARQLRKQPGLDRVILVALTGYSQQEDRRRSQEAGFDHFIVKPIDPQVLPTLLASHDGGSPNPE